MCFEPYSKQERERTTSRCTRISSCDSVASVFEPDTDLGLWLSLLSEPRATLFALFTLLWVKMEFFLWVPREPSPERFSEARTVVVMRTLRAGRVPTRTAGKG